MDTTAVFEHHRAALSSGDLEEVLTGCTDQLVLSTPDWACGAARQGHPGFSDKRHVGTA